jgi:hypothetical protein
MNGLLVNSAYCITQNLTQIGFIAYLIKKNPHQQFCSQQLEQKKG